jgi:hypothetical protein
VTSSPKISSTLWFDKEAEAAAQHYTKAILVRRSWGLSIAAKRPRAGRFRDADPALGSEATSSSR